MSNRIATKNKFELKTALVLFSRNTPVPILSCFMFIPELLLLFLSAECLLFVFQQYTCFGQFFIVNHNFEKPLSYIVVMSFFFTF